MDSETLAEGLQLLSPHVQISNEAALKIAKESIAMAGDGQGRDYAYRVVSIAKSKKQLYVDSQAPVMAKTYQEMVATVFPYLDAGQRGVNPPEPIQGREADCKLWYEMGARWSNHHKTFQNAEVK